MLRSYVHYFPDNYSTNSFVIKKSVYYTTQTKALLNKWCQVFWQQLFREWPFGLWCLGHGRLRRNIITLTSGSKWEKRECGKLYREDTRALKKEAIFSSETSGFTYKTTRGLNPAERKTSLSDGVFIARCDFPFGTIHKYKYPWSTGQSFWLLITRSRVRFSALS